MAVKLHNLKYMAGILAAAPLRTEFDGTVARILQRPEYRHLQNALRDFIERLRENISRWLSQTFDSSRFAVKPALMDRLSTIFIIIGLLVILAIVVFIAVKAGKTFERKARVKEILGERISGRTTPGSLRSKASDYLAEGDFRQAIRYEFIALLLLMHEKQLIYIDETKTNREICSFLKQEGFKAAASFQSLTSIFDVSWYGHKACGREVYETWGNSMEPLWNEVLSSENKNK